VEVKSDDHNIGLAESKEGSPQRGGTRILFVSTKIDLNNNPLLD
jgi:hypothetical protein